MSPEQGSQARRPIYSSPEMEIARGYLLIGVFYMHALYGVIGTIGDPMNAPVAGLQMKLLAPNVAAFFFLNGMTSRHLASKPFRNVFRHSLMLLILAMSSHVLAALIDQLLFRTHGSKRAFARALFEPLFLGTGYVNYIGWFLVVLAVARLFVYAFQYSYRIFAVAVAGAAGAIMVGQYFGAADNIYEWRNWPAAVLFMLIGCRMPPAERIPDFVGYAGLPLALVLAWFNTPTLLSQGPCLACNLTFVAQPMVGQYGAAPVYLLQQLAFITFLWWVSGRFPKKLPSRVARYFGRAPLQLLILHGFVLVSLYPLAARGLPRFENGYLFFSVLSSVIVVHVIAFHSLKGLLDRFVILCSKASYILAQLHLMIGRRMFLRAMAVRGEGQ